jgi:hypothetical protein
MYSRIVRSSQTCLSATNQLHMLLLATLLLLLVTRVAPFPSSVCNGSHFLLMNHTLAWFFLTPQFGAIPSALADHSELFLLASLIFQPPLLPATAMCRASVPSSYFLPCSLTALLRNLVLLRTPFTNPAPPLDHTLHPALNLVDSDRLPLPAIVAHMETTSNIPATVLHPITLLQQAISVPCGHGSAGCSVGVTATSLDRKPQSKYQESGAHA